MHPDRVYTDESSLELPRRKLIGDALENCRQSLHRQLLVGLSPDTLRAPIREFATLARERQIPPERMLALIKDVLRGVPDFERRNGTERLELVGQFAQIAIHAYYSDESGSELAD
jgi:hypothetical protein